MTTTTIRAAFQTSLRSDRNGSKCEHCDDAKGAEWHHIVPRSLDKSARRVTSLRGASARRETLKCLLLCSDCHHAIHASTVAVAA